MRPRTLIIRTAGTNCDRELAHAFTLAGSEVNVLHLNRLIADPDQINQFDLICFPGGFSYGDDIAAGRIFATRLRLHLLDPLRRAMERGVPMIGICNGFQVLVKLGLLPDPQPDAIQRTTLADNENGQFIDRWVTLQVTYPTPCIWTSGLHRLELPIAHGEGRFVVDAGSSLETMQDRGQVVLRYEQNPNGSVDDIAGICDPSGLVFGLMPHPERCCDLTHHPHWTRWESRRRGQMPDGLRLLANAVTYVVSRTAAAAGA